MPIISVGRDKLFQALGRSYTEEEFQTLCFDYGIELDDVTSEKELLRKEYAQGARARADNSQADAASEEVLYKIDIPANRYDMLCLEGIARALNIFNRRLERVDYRLADMTGKQMQRVIVRPETALVRPFVVAAVLRGLHLDAARFGSFIDLQDKLHANLCRQRSLVAIGTHDIATLQGPFTYEALPPEDIVFTPLKQSRAFNARELMQHYLGNDSKLGKFVPIIHGSVVYPVILDARRTVLSLPPIINGAHSAVTLETRDVFIECTATVLSKAKVVLNTMCTMFSEYCAAPFEVEPVEVVDSFRNVAVFPDLSSFEIEVPTKYINGCIGADLGAKRTAELLSRMALEARPSTDGAAVRVLVPPTRSDILHSCDIMEDVAIAHGYNNIARTLPKTFTAGRELPLNQLTDLLRMECAMAGYTEVLTWALCSTAENFHHMQLPEQAGNAVSIGNPATLEFEVCRTSLLPGLLKTLGANKSAALPVNLFEISDVVLLAEEAETGAQNVRRLGAVHSAQSSGFEIIHGLVNRIMETLGVPLLDPRKYGAEPSTNHQMARYGSGYEWTPHSSPTFFPGRQAAIIANGRHVGYFGVVHPDVLQHFDIPHPVSAVELDLEPFCYDNNYQPLPVHLKSM